MLHVFVAALEAVLVEGPTEPDSWAETNGCKARKEAERNARKLAFIVNGTVEYEGMQWQGVSTGSPLGR
jgi:hypothetical protein